MMNFISEIESIKQTAKKTHFFKRHIDLKPACTIQHFIAYATGSLHASAVLKIAGQNMSLMTMCKQVLIKECLQSSKLAFNCSSVIGKIKTLSTLSSSKQLVWVWVAV